MSAVPPESPRASADPTEHTTEHSAPESQAGTTGTDFGANEWLVDELYQRYLADPSSVAMEWWNFFADYQPPAGSSAQTAATAPQRTAPAPGQATPAAAAPQRTAPAPGQATPAAAAPQRTAPAPGQATPAAAMSASPAPQPAAPPPSGAAVTAPAPGTPA